MIYIISIGAFQSLLLVFLMVFNSKKKSTDVLLISLLVCIFLHLSIKFIIYADNNDTVFKKEFNTFIDLAYGPLLWMIAKKVKNHRYNFLTHWYFFVPAVLSAICFFAIIFSTFFLKINPVNYIHLYNLITKIILIPLLLIFSFRAYYISTRLKDFWQSERQVIRNISVLFLGFSIAFFIFSLWNAFTGYDLFPSIYMRILFYVVLVLVCITILRYFIISISEKNQIAIPENFENDFLLDENQRIAQDVLSLPVPILNEPFDKINLTNTTDSFQSQLLPQSGFEGRNNERLDESSDNLTSVAYKKFSLNEEHCKYILQKLEKLMIEQQLFTEPDLNLIKLAEISKISRYHISEALNKYAQKSFYNYINEYRIKNVLSILEKCNSINIKPNILPIAFEAGFNSKSSFNLYFKKYTGLTPSDYIKINLNPGR